MHFNLGGSILSGALVAFLVLIITLFYSGQLGAGLIGLVTGVILAVAIGVGCYFVLRANDKRSKKFLTLTEEWIKKIEEGKEELSISEMQKQLRDP